VGNLLKVLPVFM